MRKILSKSRRKISTGADEVIRTPDLLITNQLLYQLSYIGKLFRMFFVHPCTFLFIFPIAPCHTSCTACVTLRWSTGPSVPPYPTELHRQTFQNVFRTSLYFFIYFSDRTLPYILYGVRHAAMVHSTPKCKIYRIENQHKLAYKGGYSNS